MTTTWPMEEVSPGVFVAVDPETLAAAKAAIARVGAGDGLVERATAVIPLLKEKTIEIQIEPGEIPDEICMSAADTITDLLAHIAALTAQVAGQSQMMDAWRDDLTEAHQEAAALRAKVAENRIGEPHDPGDFVGDIFYGHPVKTTMGTHRWTGTEWVALPSEAEALAGLLAGARKEAAAHIAALTAERDDAVIKRAAWEFSARQMEAERDALRKRVARLEGALQQINVGYGWAARIARAALTETPADGVSNG